MKNILKHIMCETAMRKNRPSITRPDIDALGYTSNLIPMDADWKKRISNQWWSTDYKGDISPYKDMIMLRDRLLSFDGENVCMAYREPDIDNIMQYGQLWIGDKNHVKMMKGEECRCHSNVCELWQRNRDLKDGKLYIATGYALSKDSMWRQHSWLVLRKTRSYKVIETTVMRKLYFGFCMDEETAERFCYENL